MLQDFKPNYSPKILPLVYDDSLSYYELLCKLVQKINEFVKEINEYEVINKIEFKGSWDITKQYHQWSIVDNEGIGYLAIRHVPKGVEITDQSYWIVICDYSVLFNQLREVALNVKIFGAKGDGVTDDTDAIRTAIRSMTKGGTLVFPSGTYLISGTIELPDEKKTSLRLDNAIIKQTVALSPMVLVASGSASNNYPQTIYGNGTFDMDSKGGIGIQISNNGGYASINDIQVRNCSNGIGIMMGDTMTGSAVSLQAELNNVKIYGTDSAMDGIGLYVNAYDCVFNNLYLYLCKIGCQTYHGGHNFNYVHVWCHSYNAWDVSKFKNTIGFKMRGTSFFNTLYLDSVYTGLQTNGYDQLINNCYYTSDITDVFPSDLVGRVIEREKAEKVTINNGLFYNPRTYKMQIFYVNNNDTVSSQTVGRMSLCTHVVQNYKNWIPFDEGNNIPLNGNRHNPVKRSALTANTAYKIGYLKLSESNNLHLYVELKGYYASEIKARVLNTGIDTYNTSMNVIYAGGTPTHVYYGEIETYDNINWLPIYIKSDASVTRLPYIDCSYNGDSGFYPCYADSFSDLETGVVSALHEFT